MKPLFLDLLKSTLPWIIFVLVATHRQTAMSSDPSELQCLQKETRDDHPNSKISAAAARTDEQIVNKTYENNIQNLSPEMLFKIKQHQANMLNGSAPIMTLGPDIRVSNIVDESKAISNPFIRTTVPRRRTKITSIGDFSDQDQIVAEKFITEFCTKDPVPSSRVKRFSLFISQTNEPFIGWNGSITNIKHIDGGFLVSLKFCPAFFSTKTIIAPSTYATKHYKFDGQKFRLVSFGRR